MPHVVIEDALGLVEPCAHIELSVVREGSDVLKIVDVFLSRSERSALVECVAVEGGRSQAFFVQLAQKGRQITVRLLPATDPDKTRGVKQLMALVASQLRGLIVGSRFGKTNLQEFLA